MKKMLLLVVVLMAVPAMAVSTVTVTAADNGDCSATVSYASDLNLIRGFGLDLSVSGGQTITGVQVLNANYRIFPGQIVIVDGNVVDYNTPYAPGDLGDGSVTVELGSLYTMDANYSGDPDAGYNKKPAKTGTLIKVTVSGSCTLSIAENAARGGVVMEDPDEDVTPTLNGVAIVCGPVCWSYATQCHGDADGDGDVDTVDWVPFRTGFGVPAKYQANICADYNHDGKIDTVDWPEFRTWFGKVPPANCP